MSLPPVRPCTQNFGWLACLGHDLDVILCNTLVVVLWSLRIALSNSTTIRCILFLLTYFAYTYLNFRLVNHLLPHCRRPCIKAFSYITAQAEEGTPIWVAPKAKRQKRLQNVFWMTEGSLTSLTIMTIYFTALKVVQFCADSSILLWIWTHQLTLSFSRNHSREAWSSDASRCGLISFRPRSPGNNI